MTKPFLYVIAAVILIFNSAYSQELSQYNCDYLGQTPPGDSAIVFAPGIVSTSVDEYRLVVSPTGKEIAFTRAAVIMIMRKDGKSGWTDPAPAFAPYDSKGSEPCFSSDGSKLYFCSRRNLPGAKEALNAWVSEKSDGAWGKPRHLGHPVIDQTVHACSVTADGSIYCSGLTILECIDGVYQTARPLSPPVKGWHPFVSPDGSFLIFDKYVENTRNSDLYIIFQRDDHTWTYPVNMGPHVNTANSESTASVSPDGAYLFFTRHRDIYWVKADFIADLRAAALKNQ